MRMEWSMRLMKPLLFGRVGVFTESGMGASEEGETGR